jgi:hypothetical protein
VDLDKLVTSSLKYREYLHFAKYHSFGVCPLIRYDLNLMLLGLEEGWVYETLALHKKACFWEASWLDGMQPKDTGPKRKRCLVRKALDNKFWVRQMDTQDGLTVDHIV